MHAQTSLIEKPIELRFDNSMEFATTAAHFGVVLGNQRFGLRPLQLWANLLFGIPLVKEKMLNQNLRTGMAGVSG